MSSPAISPSSGSSSPKISKRRVSFGNPALGTYKGSVHTIPQHASNTNFQPLVEGAQATQKMVAMIGVPPEHVPESLMDLIRCHRPFIEHVRVVIAETDDDGEEEGHENATNETETESDDNSQKHQQEQRTSLVSTTSMDENDEKRNRRTYLVLFQMTSEQDADNFVQDLSGKPYIAFDDQDICLVEHVVALQGDDGVSLLNPHFAPSVEVVNTIAEAAQASGKSSSPKSQSGDKQNSKPSAANSGGAIDDQNCAVCLERLALNPDDDQGATTTAKTAILTTVCNHTFHLDCLQQWSGPCIVCRFDHSGLNETLSQCHVCGTTEHNYVCLICGCISCVGTPSAAGAASASGATSDGTSSFHNSHAGQHYKETLHAYALDTQNQHVYDFAGQGYVHRLVQNKEDGKLVEVNDPFSSSQERSMNPGLSEAQEGEVVHRKLEGFASQYYTLLKSQLEQQRTFYEQRLQEVRREFALKERNDAKSKADLVSVLKQERKQLGHRLQNIQRKKDKALEDAKFLKSMNESLKANKPGLEQQIQQAQSERIASREMIQKYVPALEEKVTTLMLQLEDSMKSS
ncbi:MAG: hypothetical protein SGILL_008483 [Bacillariaceae sp.]